MKFKITPAPNTIQPSFPPKTDKTKIIERERREASGLKETALDRIAKHFQPLTCTPFEYSTTALVAPGGTIVTTDMFTVPDKYERAVIKGIGIFAWDANSYANAVVDLLINTQSIPGYRLPRSFSGVSLYDYNTLQPEVYIEVPKNGIFSIRIQNNMVALVTWNFALRTKGWFLPEP